MMWNHSATWGFLRCSRVPPALAYFEFEAPFTRNCCHPLITLPIASLLIDDVLLPSTKSAAKTCPFEQVSRAYGGFAEIRKAS